jgi:hypothetical protein
MGRLAHGGVVHVQIAADGAHDHLAELTPTRICTGVPPARWVSSAWRATRRCIRTAA